MRFKRPFGPLAIAISFVWLPPPAVAQSDRKDDLTHCVRQFYDTKMYNWLAFENTCSFPIVVHSGFIKPDGAAGTSGLSEIKPGKTASTGLSRKEVAGNGQLVIAVCPSGEHAVFGAKESYWSPVAKEWHCKADFGPARAQPPDCPGYPRKLPENARACRPNEVPAGTDFYGLNRACAWCFGGSSH